MYEALVYKVQSHFLVFVVNSNFLFFIKLSILKTDIHSPLKLTEPSIPHVTHHTTNPPNHLSTHPPIH